MRILPIVLVGCLVAGDAVALEFPSTCRGATAVVSSISGLNSRGATLTAKHARGDAVSYCADQPAGTTDACVAKFMRDRRDTTYFAKADCKAATLTSIARGLPRPEFPKSTWKASYHFPIPATCGGDNMQAIAIFKILCPAYQGATEE